MNLDLNFKDSPTIKNLHKVDLFSPLMTKYELSDYVWSDTETMTSSVKSWKIRFFDVFALIEILDLYYDIKLIGKFEFLSVWDTSKSVEIWTNLFSILIHIYGDINQF